MSSVGRIRLHGDGVLVQEDTSSTATSTLTGCWPLGWRRRPPRLPHPAGAPFLTGRLDEASVYDRELSPEDVAVPWSAGSWAPLRPTTAARGAPPSREGDAAPGVSTIRCVIGRLRTVTLIDVREDRDDTSAHPYRIAGPASPGLRTLGLVAGSLLAVAATVVVFLTEDPRVLRLAVVAAAWGFVLAALVASRRSPEGAAAGGGERAAVERAGVERAAAELRLAYEIELEREVAGRREHELRVENELRRTAEQSMRTELEALRAELAQVAELRREVDQLAGLRREVAELAELRQDLAGLAELRTALAGLDLTALAELRTDVGRLRAEPTEQLSGEMLVERVMLRTQSTRTVPAAPEPSAPRTVEADGWTSPAPELTAALPVVRADGPDPGTRQVEEVGAEPRRGSVPPPPPPPLDWLAERSLIEPDAAAEARRTRQATAAEPTPPPPADRPLPNLPPSGETESRRRRTDDAAPTPTPTPDELLTTERPSPQRQRPPVPVPTAAPPTAEAPAPAAEDPGRRLADLLADSGPTPPSGGRRRRRYREDDETDEVLARVLGRD